MFAVSDQGSGRRAEETQMLCLNFEVARQVWTASLFGPVQAVPIADEGEQEHSRLAPSHWELARDDFVL